MFSDKNVFRLCYLPISLAAAVAFLVAHGVPFGTFRGLSVLVALSLHRSLSVSSKCSSTSVIDEIRCYYLLSDTFYIIHIVFYIKTQSRSNQGEGK